MTAILSVLAVLGAAMVYYQAAKARALPAVAWALVGAILYYGGFLIWMHGVLRWFIGAHFQVHSFWVGIGMDLSAIGFGFGVALLFKLWVLDRQKSSAD
jgi:hypothetical protein